MSDNTVTILLVDDDDVAAEAVERAFHKARIANPIVRATDGIDAFNQLRGLAGHSPVPYPYLILLDLKMPRMDGLTFLRELRSDVALGQSVVFVLTTSASEKDRFEAYKQFISGYILKSRVGEEFIEMIQMLDHYWRVIEFPPKKS